ncbi:MAG TPA: DUF3099 domain-containing protein [Nakamurella sp.]|jgi:hypothetical protein|nr:DUF3099 domain-containing protein [Nakamurella sp.]
MTSYSAGIPVTPGPDVGGFASAGGVPPRRGQATVITEAQPSYDDQLRGRRKRYMIMMSLRVPFLILATLLYQTPWLALLIIGISIPLPWMAVLIANDRPARKRVKVMPGSINDELALPPGSREIVDSEPMDS